MAQRDLYLDRIRTWLTILVLLAHLAMTYGSPGGWYYREFFNQRSPSSILLTLFVVTVNAFSMGFFFLISGYFTPTSLDRKGSERFLIDRFVRLGVPLMVFSLFLDPLTIALVGRAEGRGFVSSFFEIWQTGDFSTGPLWFVSALLIFNLCYWQWRRLQGPIPAAPVQIEKHVSTLAERTTSVPQTNSSPSQWMWLFSLFAVASGTLLLRQLFPTGERTHGFWIGNFVPYVFLFTLGIRARRLGWLNELQWRQARPFVILAVCAWPALPICYWIYQAQGRQIGSVRGFEWPNIVFAFWETIIIWGFVPAGLLWFRRYLNQPSALGDWLGRRAYGAYILHTPVLVAVALLCRHWTAHSLVKFAVVSPVAIGATWIAADLFLRLPLFRRVL